MDTAPVESQRLLDPLSAPGFSTSTPQSQEIARDRVSQAYLGLWGGEETTQATRKRIDWIANQVKGEQILDIGCSEGILAILLARSGKNVVGIDINSDALNYGRQLLNDDSGHLRELINFVQGDFLTMDLPRGPFDTVVVTEVLEHLAEPSALLERAMMCLKPGGHLVATTPFGVMPDPDHRQTFTLSSFLELFREIVVPQHVSIEGRYICFVGHVVPLARDSWREFDYSKLLEITEQGVLGVQEILYNRITSLKQRLERAWERQRTSGNSRLPTASHDTGVGAISGFSNSLTELSNAEEHRLRSRLQAYFSRLAESERRRAQAESNRSALIAENERLQKLHEEFSSALSSWVKQIDRERSTDVHKRITQLETDLRFAQFSLNFENFRNQVVFSGAKEIVFIFSGTTFIQSIRANRPIRLAHCFLSAGIPVLFNYHRWKDTDEIPTYKGDILFQSPIDYTLRLMERLAEANFGEVKRTFIVSYPHPEVCKLLNRFNVNNWVTIYDCRDDWEAFEKVGMAKWYKSWAEKYVVRNCDAVTCVSAPLQKKMQFFDNTKRIELLPNGYDTTFRSPDFMRTPSKRPKIGYFGHLTNAWFDWDSLARIAAARPQFQFELIGHGYPKDLRLPANVTLFGPLPHSDINRLAASWSAAIICFKIGRLADGVDPIKIYEYLSLGLPVISFRMPQIDSYPYTRTVDDVPSFVTAIDEAVATIPDIGRIESWLHKNTWELRADRYRQIAAEVVEHPPIEKSFHLSSKRGAV